jgi:hypothetical protein
MVSGELLRVEAAHYRELASQLKLNYADIDDETLTDTLEGLSDLPAMIEEVVRSSLEDAALVVGLKSRMDEMAQRLARLKLRYDRKRELACWAMGSAGIGRLQAADFSASLAQGGQKLEVADETRVPEIYFVPQPPRLDRASVTDALKRGEKIEGAYFVQSGPHIVVRTR